jgi:hypothetical protein
MLRTTTALVASLGLLLAGQAGAAEAKAKKAAQKEMTFVGDIASVNAPANEFTVKGTEKGGVSEMTFHVGRPLSISIDDQMTPLNELKKGERVTVTYETSGSTPLAKHLHRHKKTT